MTNDLIYDVGMHVGHDTAFYLACGFRVLAIEADPDLVTAGKQRFKAEVDSGRLTILNVAIAEQPGTAEFWINERDPHLNSFSRAAASRGQDHHHGITVQCRRLDDIISEFGVPHYLKIDIEGHDIICCEQLSPSDKPKYISVEMTRIELLLKLRDLGYDRFKLIRQLNLQPVGLQEIKLHQHILRGIHRIANYRTEDRDLSLRLLRSSAANILRSAKALGFRDISLQTEAKPFQSRRVPDWSFVDGRTCSCSGSFGEDLPGEWLSWEEAAYVWHHETWEHKKLGHALLCDLHATTSPTEPSLHRP